MANALVAAGDRGKANTDYFLGSAQPRKLKDYIVKIRDAIDPEIPLYLGEIPFLGVSLDENALNAQKLTDDTGYKAQIPFETGILKTLEWLRSMES